MGLFSSLRRTCSKYGSGALVVGALVSGASAIVLSYRAGKRAAQHPEWDTKEKAMNCIATGVAGGISAGCVIAGHSADSGKIATLMATQLLDEKKRQKFMKTAEEKIGKENIEKIKASMHPVKDEEVKPRSDGKILFIDDFTGAKTYSTCEQMWKAIDKFHQFYHTNQYAPYGKLLEYGGFERFDGVTNCIPITEDSEGNPLEGLSDMDIGFSSCKQWVDGYETDWIDVYIIDHVDPKTGNGFCTLEVSMYPVANFMEY